MYSPRGHFIMKLFFFLSKEDPVLIAIVTYAAFMLAGGCEVHRTEKRSLDDRTKPVMRQPWQMALFQDNRMISSRWPHLWLLCISSGNGSMLWATYDKSAFWTMYDFWYCKAITIVQHRTNVASILRHRLARSNYTICRGLTRYCVYERTMGIWGLRRWDTTVIVGCDTV
jgi:hypothetical protein